jgi:hypothetical protein
MPTLRARQLSLPDHRGCVAAVRLVSPIRLSERLLLHSPDADDRPNRGRHDHPLHASTARRLEHPKRSVARRASILANVH